MDMILSGMAIYVGVWFILRLTGRRTMSEMTTFDFILLLICGEATQQALLGDDFSVTNALIVIITLTWLERTLSAANRRWPRFGRLMEGRGVLILRDGRPNEHAMREEHVGIPDILHEARSSQGLTELEQVDHVVLEPTGGLSIIPKKDAP